MTNYLVVGAGLFGSTIAERIANDLKQDVFLIDKREHVGGNCYSAREVKTDIECHLYGPHIFHTSNQEVWEYINQFSKFNNYRHKVITTYKNKKYFLPINLSTINEFFNLNLNPSEAEKRIEELKPQLYDAFFKGYTIKQWGIDPKDLPPETLARLPIRFNYNIDYFNTLWQGLPLHGYDRLFANILSSKRIVMNLNTDYFSIRHTIPKNWIVIYTGPIDQFFDYQYGRLGWRTQSFNMTLVTMNDFQGTSVMNYADKDLPFTRVTEFKHFYPERDQVIDKTMICAESSHDTQEGEDPYYPINTEEDKKILSRYIELTKECKNVIFGGRLGTYKYLDMDTSIQSALDCYKEKIYERSTYSS